MNNYEQFFYFELRVFQKMYKKRFKKQGVAEAKSNASDQAQREK